MALTKITEKIISDNLSISGIASASNFKTGTTNVHNVGVELAGINVLGADTPIGTGATIYNDGGARFSGIVTATDFSGQSGGAADFPNGLTGTTGTFSGAISAASATITGNLGVGGVVTYEDVTNVDSVGVITARSGINVTGGNITLGDSGGATDDRIVLGAGSDFSLRHDGTDTIITNATGDLYINNTGSNSDDIIIKAKDDVNIQVQDGENAIVAKGDGAVDLYHDNSLKFETTSSGTRTTGAMHINDGAADSNRISVGNGGDLKIFHTNPNTFIQNSSAALVINAARLDINNAADNEQMARFTQDGAVELYHNNVKTTWTHGSGFNIKGGNTSDNTELIITGNEGQPASILMSADDGDDNADHWRMYSNADNSFTLNSYAGGSYQSILKGTSSRSIELNYQGSKKLETTSSGIDITGDLTLPTTDAKIQLKDGNNYIQFINADKTFKFMNAWSAGEFTFHVNGAERLRLDASGNLGIGGGNATIPRRLWVYDGSNDPYFRIQRGSTGSVAMGGIEIASSNGSGNNVLSTMYARSTGNSGTTGATIFQVRDQANNYEVVRLCSQAQGAIQGNRMLVNGNTVCVFGSPHGTSGAQARDGNTTTYNTVYEHSSSSYRTNDNGMFGGTFVVSGNASYWYPVWFSLPTNSPPQELWVNKYVHNYATWDGTLFFRASLAGTGYGAYTVQHRVHYYSSSSKDFIGKIVYTSHNNAWLVLWMLGGGRSYGWGTVGGNGITVNVGDDGNTHNLGPGNSSEGHITSNLSIPQGYEQAMSTGGMHSQSDGW